MPVKATMRVPYLVKLQIALVQYIARPFQHSRAASSVLQLINSLDEPISDLDCLPLLKLLSWPPQKLRLFFRVMVVIIVFG